MSRNALILENSLSPTNPPAQLRPVPRSGEYSDLIHRVFRSHSVLAVIGAGAASRSAEACSGIAAELAASAKRVVVVQVDALLRASTPPAASACRPGGAPNVWLWPSASAASVEFFQSPQQPSLESDWLAVLRRDFDAVLLACPSLETAPAVADIAALADAAVLVVESGQTARQQIQRDQRTLELTGAKLTGLILMQRR